MKLRIVAVFGLLCLACASPKYNYYFDHVKLGSKSPDQAVNSPLAPVDPASLTASTDLSITELAQVLGEAAPVVKSNKSETPHLSYRKQVKVAKLFAKIQAKHTIESQDKPVPLDPDGDPKKNGWAISGFILSLLAWVLFWPLVFLGIIFSIIGLKSQKRGMAIAGLVIGLAGIVILIVASSQGKI